jgi:hypothetical protein
MQMLMSALPHPPNDLAAWLAPFLVLIVEREAASVAKP